MREIGKVDDARGAAVFADYLLTRGIRVRVEPKTEGASIWVYDEDHRATARAELDDFNRNPHDPRYAQIAAQARAIEREAQAREKQFHKNVVDVRTRWGTMRVGPRPVTVMLIGISLVVAVITQLGQAELADPWIQELLIAPVHVEGNLLINPGLEGTFREGELWRLVTPIFIHFSLLHFLFNMSWVLMLGSQIEWRLGSRALLGLVLVAAVLSNLAQYFWHGPNFGGMSGVAYALFGFVWMKSRYDPAAGLSISPGTVVLMVGWLVLCMVGPMDATNNVANMAHGVGLGVGVVAGIAPYLWRRMRR